MRIPATGPPVEEDGWREGTEAGETKQLRAEYDERKEGRMRARVWCLKRCVGASFSVSFVLEAAGRGVVCGEVRGTGRQLKREDAGDAEALASRSARCEYDVGARARLLAQAGGVFAHARDSHPASESRLRSRSASYTQITKMRTGKASRRKIQKTAGTDGYEREETARRSGSNGGPSAT
jgi:hypothetical protein